MAGVGSSVENIGNGVFSAHPHDSLFNDFEDDYEFSHWEPVGDVTISYWRANPATWTVYGTGTLRAIYTK